MKAFRKIRIHRKYFYLILIATFFTFACSLPNLRSVGTLPTKIPGLYTLVVPSTPVASSDIADPATQEMLPTPDGSTQATQPSPVPVQTNADYRLGDLVSYTAQPGDTLPALASRFRTTIENIAAENPLLPPAGQLTTLSPGQPLAIRLLVEPGWDQQFQILPDYLFVNGPAEVDFDTFSFINRSNGWLKNYVDRSGENAITGVQIVESITQNYSISPRLILAVLEYKLHALTDPVLPISYSLGSTDEYRITLARQLSWAANVLNNGYYGWRAGTLTQFTNSYGHVIIPNPWQNAATVALQFYISRFATEDEFITSISQDGLVQAYQNLFGPIDWNSELEASLIPGDLKQPPLTLPFQSGLKWAYTAGPHSGWGIGFPWAAIDFAPPSLVSGCDPSEHWAVAMAEGVIARSEGGVVVLDLDGDGKFQTGWTIFYLHIFPDSAPTVGTWLKKGGLIGHPSCVGGQSTGRNLHIARLYNGEWIPAGSLLPFNMDGWVVFEGEKEYKGYLTRDPQVVFPSNLGDWPSQLMADPPQP